MAQRIKKKYLEDGAVDGVKLKLLKDQAVKTQDQAGNDVELIKLDSGDKVLLKGQEAALKSDVVNEENRAKGEEGRIEGLVTAEVSRAQGEEGRIEGKVDAEKSRAESAEQGLQTAISNAVSDMTTALGNEISRAESEEGRIEGKLDAEILRATNKDNDLQSQIDFIKENVDPVALDSLTEIVSAFQTADGNLNSAISSLSTAASNAVTAEENRAKGEEGRIEGLVTSEVSRATSEETAIKGRLSVLESQKAISDFDVESISVELTNLVYIDLSRKVIAKSMRVCIGRLALHQGYDYSVSVEMVGGVEKTRLTWMGDFAAGGIEEIYGGETVFVEYAY